MALVKNKKKVLVALSGGVDSATSAALLKEKGYDVYGIFLKLWSFSGEEMILENQKMAEMVAKKLNIPLFILDISQEFKKEVVDYFIKEYKEGKTPNPCVVCNSKIKFHFLLEKAKNVGCDFIATGHYVRVKKRDGFFRILKAKDIQKDQSYFLWKLTQRELSKSIFPLGRFKKEEVRRLAEKFGLPNAQRKDSQEICFLPFRDYRDFFKKIFNNNEKIKKGKIIDKNGNIIGEHEGIFFYTIGQRKGLKIKVTNPAFDPYYVLKINPQKNLLVVGKLEDLYKRECFLKDFNFIVPDIKFPLNCHVKIRSTAKEIPAIILPENNKLQVIFKKRVWAITPGQSAVFYKKGELLGGGIIESFDSKD